MYQNGYQYRQSAAIQQQHYQPQYASTEQPYYQPQYASREQPYQQPQYHRSQHPHQPRYQSQYSQQRQPFSHQQQEEQRHTNEYNSYIDPYAQLQNRTLAHNEYDTYVRPLPSQEFIADGSENQQLNDSFYTHTKPSPVESHGLRPIKTSAVDEPTVDASIIKAQREREEQGFIIPPASASDLEPIKVEKEKGMSARRYKRMRKKQERDMVVKGPPPDTVNCGWSEYQGGATYEDIHHYRDYELGHLKQAQREQAESGTPVYYS